MNWACAAGSLPKPAQQRLPGRDALSYFFWDSKLDPIRKRPGERARRAGSAAKSCHRAAKARFVVLLMGVVVVGDGELRIHDRCASAL